MHNLKQLLDDNRDAPRRYEIKGAAKEEAEIFLYDAIGGGWGIDAGKFAKDLKGIKAGTIHLRINSPGGDVFAAQAIATAISEHPASVIAHIDGLAASAASFVMLAADRIVASEGAFVMVHNPWSLTIGDADDHTATAALLSKIGDSMAARYAKRSGKTVNQVMAWMDAETWFTAEEAKDAGLVDEVVDLAPAAAASAWNLSAYQNAPASLIEQAAAMPVAAMATATEPPADEVQGSAPDKPEEEVSQMENPVVNPQGQTQAPDLEAIRAEERRRISEIQRIGAAARMSPDAVSAAVDNNSSVQAFRELAFDAMLAAGSQHETRVGVNVIRDQADTRRGLMVSAVLNRVSPAVNAVDQANDFRSMSLLRMAEEGLVRAGVSVRGKSPGEIAILAMHATGDFPYVLENTARKLLLDSYGYAQPTYRLWTKASTAVDFKTMSRVRLGETPVFEKVAEGGEITMGTMAESREQYAIATYGKGISFTRQMLINDDLGAFNGIVSQFGFQAARLENKTVYAILTANANLADGTPLFDAAHLNTGTGVIGNTALDAMFSAMAIQKGLDATSILNLRPKYLITSPAKNATARTAMVSTPTIKPSDQNQFAGMLEVVSDGELSGAPWYGACDPGLCPTIEYAHLEGAQGPQIIRKENEGGILGVSLYAFLDFGAKAIDYRGLWRSTGA